jgi:hypothetical protein
VDRDLLGARKSLAEVNHVVYCWAELGLLEALNRRTSGLKTKANTPRK